METTLLPLLSTCFLLATVLSSASPPLLLGVHPLDEKYFASEVIKCKDGSKAFDRARLNDNYCDCPDGTDEPGNGPEIRCVNSIPTESNKVAEERQQFGQFGIVLDASLLQGTSACPTGKFYCKNLGSTPKFIFSSCVNDRVCDCCDGSDEYDGSIRCPNTCIMGGNLAYKSGDTTSFGTINEHSTVSDLENMYAKETKSRIKLDDLIQKLIGLKAVIILQLFVISCVVAFRIFLRRAKSRRRRYH